MTVLPMEATILATVRVQEKGQVTIPSDIRKKLRLKKGDLVTISMRENGVVIQPVKVAVQEALSGLERSLAQRGLKLDDLLAACQRVGGERAARDFGLSEAEKAALYNALQLQAQQALETIRLQSEAAGLDRFSDEELNAEIQSARHADAGPDRT
jgi:AbrB family looped-hinge helix DNA binding protein